MKNILIIGLGRFGKHIAMQLNQMGHEIMAVDLNEERVEKVLPFVTNAQIGDSTDAEFLKSLGIGNYDICFVTIGGSFQNSLETTSLLKELGARLVISRAERDVHEKFLLRNGADKVIYPEHSMGIRVARNLLSSGFVDMFELSSDFSMAEFKIPREWIGKTLRELKVREKYNINLIGLKHGDKMNMNVAPDEVFPADCTVVAAGANSDLNKVSEN